MQFIAASLLIIVALSAMVVRFTSLHPLLAGLLAGLPGGFFGFLVSGLVLSPAVWPIAGLAFFITAAFGALGGFFGWLRRESSKRNI